MDYKKRAIRARNLLKDDGFQGIMKDLRNNQMVIFANTTAQEVEKREAAHAIFRAFNEIEFIFTSRCWRENHRQKGTATPWRLNRQ